jgi:hypothetical protein
VAPAGRFNQLGVCFSEKDEVWALLALLKKSSASPAEAVSACEESGFVF